MTARSLNVVFAALLVALALDAAAAGERVVKLTLLLYSDIYEMGEKGGRGGFARVAAAVKAERVKGGNLLVVHAGDTLSPSLMSGLDQGRAVMELNGMVGPDVLVPGNHEFDFGEQVFRARMAEIRTRLLAANLRDAEGHPVPGFADSYMHEVEGVKVGVIGITDEDSAQRSSPGTLTFQPSVATAKAEAAKLREQGADLVVLVVHAPWQTDIRLASSGSFDIVLSGHDHDLILNFDGRSVLAESKEEGEILIAVDLAVTVAEGPPRTVRWWPSFRLIDTADVSPDPEVAARIAALEGELTKDLDEPLGKTDTALDSRKATVRSGEAAIGNLIADLMREATGADVAIINGGGIRGDRQYAVGDTLTRRSVLEELPFGNKMVLLEVSGRELLAALENGVWFLGKAEGRFAQISGARIIVRADAVPGQRIVSAEVGGRPIDPDGRYKVATNDFLAAGKDGYAALAAGKILIGDVEGPLLANVVMTGLRTRGAIAPLIDGRITVQ